MADIHIYTESGESVAYPEERIPELLAAGRVSAATLYWRDGMADWEPLAHYSLPVRSSARRTEPIPASELAAATSARARTETDRITGILPRAGRDVAAAAYAPRTKPPGRPRYRLRRNPQPLTLLLQLMLVVCLVITGIEFTHGSRELQQASAGPPPIGAVEAVEAAWNGTAKDASATNPRLPKDDSDDTFKLTPGLELELAGCAALVAMLALYFPWLHRTTTNTRHLSTIMNSTPGWVVGTYFIPLVNLFRPCQTMQEIWRVSCNPRTWLHDRGSALVVVWWVLTLATIAAAVECYALFNPLVTRNDEVVADAFFLVLKATQAVWYAVFLALVTLVIRNQSRLVTKSKEQHALSTR